MSQVAIKVGPADNGRHMTLDDFEHAEVVPGYHYELGRGVIVVSDIPGRPQRGQYVFLRNQLIVYQLAHPKRVYQVLDGSSCKILVRVFESERHPDIAVYLEPQPPGEDDWDIWFPDLAIEVVSKGAAAHRRDYEEKAEEYLTVKVNEYWIVDVYEQTITVMRRRGKKWITKELEPGDIYRPRMLPGFVLDCEAVLAAAES